MTDSLLDKIDFRYYVQVLYRRKWLLIIPFLLSIVLAFLWIIKATPKYESRAVIRVSYNQSVVSRSVERVVPGARTVGAANLLIQNIMSHDNLKKLIEILNLKDDAYSNLVKEKAKIMIQKSPDRSYDDIVEVLLIDKLKENIQVRQPRNNFIEIIGKGESPDTIYLIVETLASLFIDGVLNDELSGISSSLDFSSEQLEIYRNKLEKSERTLEQYKQELAVSETEQVTDISFQINQADSMISSINVLLKQKETDLRRINAQLGRSFQNKSIIETKEAKEVRNSLITSSNRLSDVSMKVSWKDAESILLNREIRQLRVQLQQLFEKIIRTELENADETTISLFLSKQMILIDIEMYENRKSVMEDIKNRNKLKLEDKPSISLNLNRLEQEVSAYRQVYDLFLQQARGSEIEQALQKKEAEYKLKIIEPAQKPITPVEPHKKRILAICLFFGVLIGASGIFGIEYIDRSYKDVLTIEKELNLPVLGIVPKMEYLKETDKSST